MAATAICSISYSSSRPPIISRFSSYRIPRHFRHRRRRKSTSICIRNESGDDFFTSFLSHLSQPFNSLNSLPLTALGFASGLALSLPKFNFKPRQLGEWIFITSPTPFNRFVLLRCPSISFEGAELLQDVNEKLVKQERHFVRLDSGRIPSQFAGIGWGVGDQKLEYSRVCVGTDDGGVIALDWPADLDLNEEHGLDSTVLIVPGSAEGSMGENVRDFVLQCLNRGLFPVVMNPRGCAGSPLTTPRLFTAADSDDVSSAIQFLSRTRPWSTFMAVGWGFGANMLTKYLAEVGEKTPLTAATCIDNPFDLEEATRTCSGAAVNQKLTGGLINILKSNKGLFQGRSKDFDVDSALSAKSVRDFDTAISMISYGFQTIEEFYSNSSSRSMVENIKVPVLFIQSDDGTVPLFSLPRGDIAENPFTSLLLYSSLPSNTASINSVTMWSQELTIEWLMAVELALLKGRHPLLQDVDVTINPSKGLAIAEGWISESDEEHQSIINLGESDGSNGYLLKPMKDTVQHEYDSGIQLSGKGIYELQDGDYRQVNDVLPQSGLVNAEFDKQDSADAVEGDRGQVLQTAEVVMKMLDVTMPGTLKEEDKKKVLIAVDQGETLMKALQDAVPEDVRGKLTTSVSEILQTQGKNLNLDVLNIGRIANVSSELKMKINENLPKKPDDGSGDKSAHSSETISSPHDSSDWSSGSRAAGDKSSGERDDTFLSQEKSVKSFASHDSQLPSSVSSVRNGADELQNNQEHHESTMEDRALLPQSDDNGHVASTTSTSTREMPPGSEEAIKQDNRCSDGERGNWDAKENRMAGEVKPPDSWKESHKTEMPNNESEGGLQSHQESPDSQPLQKQDTESENDNEKSMPTNGSEGALQSHENSPDSQPLEKQNNETKNGDEISMPNGSDGGLQSHEKSPDSQPLEKQDSETKNPDEESMPTNGSEGGLQSHQNSPDSQPLEKQDSETKRADERSIPLNLDQNKPSSDGKTSTFSVSQALDAFAGLDDSTQVAVNSVFGVIEEMINQFEEKKEDADTKTKGHELKGNNHHSLNQNDNGDVENAKDGNGPESVDNNENHNGLQSNTSGISNDGMDKQGDKVVASRLMSKYPGGYGKINDLYLLMANKACAESVYSNYLQKFSQRSLKRGDKHLDLDTTTSLFLDYIPEEGHWKMLERSGSSMDAAGQSEASQNLLKNRLCSSVAKGSNEDELMSSYIILDSDKQNEPIKNLQKRNKLTRDVLRRSSRLDDLTRLVKNIVLDTLNVEVSRKLNGVESEEMKAMLARDVEEVANAVALAVRRNTEHNWCLNSDMACTLQDGSGFDGGHIIETISSAVMSTNYLRRMLPVGVVVGSSLASLRKFFNVASVRHGYQNEVVSPDDDDAVHMELKGQPEAKEVAEILVFEGDESSVTKQPIVSVNSKPTVTETAEKSDDKTTAAGVLSRDAVMVGAVTAALGASALLQEQKGGHEVVTRDENPSKSLEKVKHPEKSHTVKLEEAQDDNPPNMVVSLAEKAMSVAAPVVPTKEDGEVDQERLVAMLAELGQKGGILKLVGKLALLWGGIRGAMSLTNRLISFLRIAERPLAQRILAFGCMVLILWSPVVVPFLPTLLQDWATKKSSRIAELVCTFGLYIAIAGLIVLWGKKIRGYENPLQQYGIDLTSSEKVQDLLIGLIGGIMLVLSIHSINALLGFVGLSWPSSLSSSPVDNTIKFQSWIKLVFLAGQGLVTAISIAFVEELFYRSWLTEEIAVDLGDHRGIILSGLAFSLCQSSLQAIPGLWLLSLSLAGARKRKQGSLYIPIGLHAGIMASCFVLQRGGFLVYRANLPLWMTGTHPFQPFSGIVGLVFSLLLALVLYPRQPSLEKEISTTIHE